MLAMFFLKAYLANGYSLNFWDYIFSRENKVQTFIFQGWLAEWESLFSGHLHFPGFTEQGSNVAPTKELSLWWCDGRKTQMNRRLGGDFTKKITLPKTIDV